MKFELTNTEKTWRVGADCYGLELLTLKQRNAIHNLKAKGWTLENVTPSGIALLWVSGSTGTSGASVLRDGHAEFYHSDR
jgi:hypothetical protein